MECQGTPPVPSFADIGDVEVLKHFLFCWGSKMGAEDGKVGFRLWLKCLRDTQAVWSTAIGVVILGLESALQEGEIRVLSSVSDHGEAMLKWGKAEEWEQREQTACQGTPAFKGHKRLQKGRRRSSQAVFKRKSRKGNKWHQLSNKWVWSTVSSAADLVAR